MKRALRIVAGAVVGASAWVGVAAADSVTCNGSITDSGTGSTNTVTCVDDEENTVSCVNNVIVSNTNDQTAGSGGAFTTGNTTGGDAESGDASNDNVVVVDVGASCAPVATTTTTTPTPTPTPTTPAQPQVLSEQVVKPVVSAVHAGGGAGTQKNDAVLIGGSVVSVLSMAAGIVLRKRALAE